VTRAAGDEGNVDDSTEDGELWVERRLGLSERASQVERDTQLTGLVHKAVNEREHPRALSLQSAKGGAQEMSIPDPFVVEGGEGGGWGRGIGSAASKVVLESVGEVVGVAE
jgi:hypothetical protein